MIFSLQKGSLSVSSSRASVQRSPLVFFLQRPSDNDIPQSCGSFVAPLLLTASDTLHNTLLGLKQAFCLKLPVVAFVMISVIWYLLYNTEAFLICYLVILRGWWLWPSLAYRLRYIRPTAQRACFSTWLSEDSSVTAVNKYSAAIVIFINVNNSVYHKDDKLPKHSTSSLSGLQAPIKLNK